MIRQQRLLLVTQPATSIPLSSRFTSALSGPLIPMVANRIIKIYNVSCNIFATNAADTRLITIDSMDIYLNLWDRQANFLSQIALAPVTGWAPTPVAFSQGLSLGISGDPLIELYGNMIIAQPANTSLQVPQLWNVTSSADLRNTDGAAAHFFSAQFSLLYAEEGQE